MCLLVTVVTMFSFGPLRAATTPWWQSSINVESKVGTDRSIQSLDVMYPLSHTEDSLTFTDLRGRIDDDDSVELNLGLAHRFLASNPLDGIGTSNEVIFGYYGFADRLESRFDNTFYQATAGFEYFTKDYSLRLNGYLPEDERKPTTTFTQLQATGTQIFFEDRQNYERPMPGYDVELGRTFRFDGWQLYGRGSYFRFHHSDVAEIEGERFRTGIQFDGSHPQVFLPEGSQLTIGLEWQEDNIREEQTFGVIRMRVPLGSTVESRGSGVESQETTEDQKSKIEEKVNGERSTVNGSIASKESKSSPSMGEDKDGGDDSRPSTHDSRLSTWQQDRLTERIERDVDIVTGQGGTTVNDTEPAVLASTGETMTNVALAVGGTSGSGTFEKPGNLSTAIATAGPNGTVFVVDSGGTLTVNSPAVLKEGQSLIGGQQMFVLQNPDGTRTRAFSLGGGRPTIRGTQTAPTVRLDTGTSGQRLQGVAVTDGKNALRANQVDDFTIDNVTVENTGGDALRLDNVDNATIANSQINGTLDLGDTFTGRVENVTVTDGDLTVGYDAGRGTDNRFELERVTVDSGNLLVGDNAGSLNGTLRMDTVTVENGFLDLGDYAGGDPTFSDDGGTTTLTKITVGDSLSVGPYAGSDSGFVTMNNVSAGGHLDIGGSAGVVGIFKMENVTTDGDIEIKGRAGFFGSFAMKMVSSGGFLDIGPDAGRNKGSFTMTKVRTDGGVDIGNGAGVAGNVTIIDLTSGGVLEIGQNVAGDGSFTMEKVTTDGTLNIGDAVGRIDGTFSMENVEVTNGDLLIGDNAGQNEGLLTMQDVEVSSGNLLIGNNAGSVNGTLRMDTVAVENGFLELGDYAGGDPDNSNNGGTATLTNISTGDSLSIGLNSGGENGLFMMKDVNVNDRLFIDSNAGGDNGSFLMKKVSVDSGSLVVGPRAGLNGSFEVRNSLIQNEVKIDYDAGVEGSAKVISNTIKTGDLSISQWLSGPSGTIDIIDNTLQNGSISVDSYVTGNGGTVNCSGNDIPPSETISGCS